MALEGNGSFGLNAIQQPFHVGYELRQFVSSVSLIFIYLVIVNFSIHVGDILLGKNPKFYTFKESQIKYKNL